MGKTNLQEALELLKPYDTFIVAGHHIGDEEGEFSVKGDIANMMKLMGALLHHFQKHLELEPKQVEKVICRAYREYRKFYQKYEGKHNDA